MKMEGAVTKRARTLSELRRGHIRYPTAVFAIFSAILIVNSVAHAACAMPVQQSTIDYFLADPSRALLDRQQERIATEQKVRIFATVGLRTLKAIVQVVPKANIQQKTSIGIGLAKAAAACSARDGEVAHRIEDAVRRLSDPEVSRAYVKFLTADQSDPVPLAGANEEQSGRRRMLELDGKIRLQGTFPGETKIFD